MDFIWIILLALLGLAMMLKPEVLWKIEHMFTVKNGEPTELYLASMRISGVFLMLLAIICGIIIYL